MYTNILWMLQIFRACGGVLLISYTCHMSHNAKEFMYIFIRIMFYVSCTVTILCNVF
jgi:hypothetical protein